MGILCHRRIFVIVLMLLGAAGTGCSAPSEKNAMPSSVATGKAVSIAPDNAKIRYTGRVAVSSDAARYDWANTSIEFHLRAPQVELLIDDGRNDYNLFVDDVFERAISTTSDNQRYPLTLGEGSHRVKLTKRTGPNFGGGAFLGLHLPNGGELLNLSPRPTRKIEFIGDSYTVGYGNEGPALDCGGVYRPYENSARTFATIAAQQMKAESHLIAISGYGAVRNYGDPNTTSPTPVPFYYGRTLMEREDLPWDFQRWLPDAVVVKLGTNDHSTQPQPPAEVFIKGIHGLLNQVHTAYGDVPVFLLADTSLPQLVERMEIATQQQRQFGNAKTFFVKLTRPPQDQLGCDWHPLIIAHEKMAAELVAAMKPIMGW
jgi:hypothetical protein